MAHVSVGTTIRNESVVSFGGGNVIYITCDNIILEVTALVALKRDRHIISARIIWFGEHMIIIEKLIKGG